MEIANLVVHFVLFRAKTLSWKLNSSAFTGNSHIKTISPLYLASIYFASTIKLWLRSKNRYNLEMKLPFLEFKYNTISAKLRA